MAIPRASAAQAALGRTAFRRAATQTRSQAWRQIGRRGYASEHGGQKSSELPWIIGSVGFTVPAAVWLFGQGPQKGGDHHAEAPHEVGEAEGEEEPPEEDKASTEEQEPKEEGGKDEGSDSDESKDESSDEKSEDSSDEKKADSKDDSKDDAKDDSKDKAKDDSGEDKEDSSSKDDDSKGGRKMSDDGYELPGPNAPGQINKPKYDKGPGEQQKGERAPTEKQSDKDKHSDHSGAQNPYLDDSEKSKKGEGVKETAKIHGTVDSRREARGDGKPNE